MIYLSAGHHLKDPGAIAAGRQENEMAIELRNDIVEFLKKAMDIREELVLDNDNETLAQYLSRINPKEHDVVLELHFDAYNGKASGCTAMVGSDADRMDKAFGQALTLVTSKTLDIPNRGVKNEQHSHRGRLGLMRESGIVCLLEVAFIDNPYDMEHYGSYMHQLARNIAMVLINFNTLIPK